MSLESSIRKPNSIDQVVQSDIQPITMNIHHHKLMEGTTIINKKILENDFCNRMFVESKLQYITTKLLNPIYQIPIKILYQR
jgi:hypothetical protein